MQYDTSDQRLHYWKLKDKRLLIDEMFYFGLNVLTYRIEEQPARKNKLLSVR